MRQTRKVSITTEVNNNNCIKLHLYLWTFFCYIPTCIVCFLMCVYIYLWDGKHII